MRVLTVPEFCTWVRKNKPGSYVFSTENNPEMKRSGIHFSERYLTFIQSASTDRLCFHSRSGGTMCLEHVKEVHMFDDIESIGVVFDALCATPHGISVWRMIAD